MAGHPSVPTDGGSSRTARVLGLGGFAVSISWLSSLQWRGDVRLKERAPNA